MAYTPNTLSELYGGPIEGGFKTWVYTTTDLLAAVLNTGYFPANSTGPGVMGMAVGDMVWVINQSSPTSAPATLCQCTAVPATTTANFSQPTGTVTLQQTGATTQTLSNLPRNLIDGGDFTTNPWQIGTSFNGTGATTTLTADRWNAIAGASLVWNASQQSNTNVAGFSTSYQWGRSAGDTHTTGLTLGQVLETADTIRLQGLPVTLSFWNGAGGNFAAGASGGTFLAQIITGTGTNDTFLKMVSASSWTGYSVIASAAYTPGVSTYTRIGPLTGVVPTNATQLGVAFSYQPTTAASSPGITAGANEWLQFLGVQLEAGGMTTFEHLDVAEVVNLCTRYLQVVQEPTAGIAVGPASFSASSIATVHIPLASPLRKAPTLTFSAGGFIITDQAQTAHAVSAAGLTGATTGAVTLNVTAAATFSSGNSAGPAFMQGRSTGLGTIILNSDY